MTKYESKIALSEGFSDLLDTMREHGDVGSLHDDGDGWSVVLSYDADDLWDAAQIMHDLSGELEGRLQEFGQMDVGKAHEVAATQSLTVPEALARVRQRLIDKGLRPTAAAMDLVGYQTLLDILDEVEGIKPENHTGEDTWRPPGAPLGTEAALLAEREEQAFKAAKERGWILGTPAVGAGATLSVGSDRYPYTIREVETFKTGKRAGQVRAVLASLDDVVRREDGAEEQFTTRLDREPERFTVTSAVVGRGPVFKGGGGTLRLSGRTYYQAPEV